MNTYTVTQINHYIAGKLMGDDMLRAFKITGEISNFRGAAASGHLYFSLKEGRSVISAVMYKGNAWSLQFPLENGMKVVVTCGINVYEAGGVYQLNAVKIEKEGVGDAKQQLEELKERLRKEGLFDTAAKKPLPYFPKTVGVITSGTGSVRRDIENVISRRCPLVKIKLFPVLVQGEEAPAEIADAIHFAQDQGCDVLIIGRGGGSKEDLAAFDTELVARAVYQSRVPLISAVGHETDFTIADAVADRRAPTPSAAAELAVPDMAVLHEDIRKAESRMRAAYQSGLASQRRMLEQMTSRLRQFRPDYQIQIQTGKVTQLTERLQKSMQLLLHSKLAEYQRVQEKLTALDPLRILGRGYAAVYHEDNTLLTSVKTVQPGERIRVRLGDGSITARVEDTDE